jgi:hypothetical protein
MPKLQSLGSSTLPLEGETYGVLLVMSCCVIGCVVGHVIGHVIGNVVGCVIGHVVSCHVLGCVMLCICEKLQAQEERPHTKIHMHLTTIS